MHRIHHSPNRAETDSNFSFNLTLWDHLFGTYRAQPLEPHQSMTLGLPEDRNARKLGLIALLARPVKSSS
jgi:sterol desaturase/sphingolipid hydroxylase (fatty acid hydroxylase superfamily)